MTISDERLEGRMKMSKERFHEIRTALELMQVGLRLATQDDCDMMDELYADLFPDYFDWRREVETGQ